MKITLSAADKKKMEPAVKIEKRDRPTRTTTRQDMIDIAARELFFAPKFTIKSM